MFLICALRDGIYNGLEIFDTVVARQNLPLIRSQLLFQMVVAVNELKSPHVFKHLKWRYLLLNHGELL